jgi:uncharacterized cupredoxin-like copper-binding protein
MKITSRFLLILTTLALVIAACGDDSTEPTVSTTGGQTATTSTQAQDPTTTSTDDGERVVEITMTEFAFEPDRVEVHAGETVRFLVVNEGRVEHELRLSNPHRVEEHLASGHDDHEEEGGHHEEDGDVFIELQPGETGELVVDFPEDTTVYTEMVCLLPGHYEAGMVGDLDYTTQ